MNHKVGGVGSGQAASDSTAVSGSAKKIKEIKDTVKEIKSSMGEKNSLLWQMNNINDFTLDNNKNNYILESGGRAGEPTPKEKKDLRITILILDRALTLLGYKRDIFTQLGKPDIDQADFSWISKRFVRFQKSRGLMGMASMQSQAVIGKKSIDELIKALNEKAIDLASN